MERDDLRALVLDAALAQALRTLEAARANDLSTAALCENVDVADAVWHLHTTYSRELAGVRITGHPVQDAEIDARSLSEMLFGRDDHENPSFDWQVPLQWLEAAAGRAGVER